MASFSETHRKKVADVLVSGELARTVASLFHECDANESGELELALGEVCLFIVEVFEQLELARPAENLIYDVYRRFDTGHKGSLNFEESLQLVVYLCNAVLGTQTPPSGMHPAEQEPPKVLLGSLGNAHHEADTKEAFVIDSSMKSSVTALTETLELDATLNVADVASEVEAFREPLSTSLSSTLPTVPAPPLTATPPSTCSREENHSPEPRAFLQASLAQQMFREDVPQVVHSGTHTPVAANGIRGREALPALAPAKTIFSAAKTQAREIASKPVYSTRITACEGSLQVPNPKSLDDSMRSTVSTASPLFAAASSSAVARASSRAPSRERCGPIISGYPVVHQSLMRDSSVEQCRRSPSLDTHRYVASGTTTPRLAPHPASSSASCAVVAPLTVTPSVREITPSPFLGHVPATRRSVSRDPAQRKASCETITLATSRTPVVRHKSPVKLVSSVRQVSPIRLVSSSRQMSPARFVRQTSRPPSPARAPSLSRCWATERSIPLDSYPRGPFAGKVKILPRRAAADANLAVELLNSGSIECREDFAVVFSEVLNSHVLLYKVGKEQEALAGLEMS